MGRPGQSTALVAALLLLLLAAACASASPAPARLTVMDTLRARMQQTGGPAQVKTAASILADEYDVEQKELCLVEKERTACKNAGHIASFWTSHLSCCDSHDPYGSRHGLHDVGSSLLNPYTSMGSCDWTATVADGRHGGPTPAADVNVNLIERMGSASAICYFGADSDKCGGDVLCDRMVMSLEGSMYFVDKAYSYYGRSNTFAPQSGCRSFIRSGGKPPSPQEAPVDTFSKVGKSNPHQATAAAAAAHPASLLAETQGYSYGDDNRVVYEGRAVVINGIVTAMSGPFKEKLDDGTFEHGLEFSDSEGDDPKPVTGALDPTVPFVHDKTYKFTFYKRAKYYK